MLVLAIVCAMGLFSVISLGLSATLSDNGNKDDSQLSRPQRGMSDGATVFAAIALVAFVVFVIMERLKMSANQYVWAIVVFAAATAIAGGLMAAITSSTSAGLSQTKAEVPMCIGGKLNPKSSGYDSGGVMNA